MRLSGILWSAILLSALAFSAQSQSNPHYVGTDPAIRDMLISLDIPRSPQPDAAKASPFSSLPVDMASTVNLAGRWQMELDKGTVITLDLLQSGNVVFGQGKFKPERTIEDASASGSINDGILRLDVVPLSGTEMYAIALNFGRLPLSGTYIRFSAGSMPESGSLKASWLAA